MLADKFESYWDRNRVVVGISNLKKQTSRNKIEQMLQPQNLEGSTELYLSHQIKIITYLSSSLFQLECHDTPVSSQTIKFMKISRKAASPFNHQAECEQQLLGLSCTRKCFYEILFLCFSGPCVNLQANVAALDLADAV